MIKSISKDKVNEIISVIQRSFSTVAVEFSLTKENCSSHPAFITEERLNEIFQTCDAFLGKFYDNRLIGTIVLKKGSGDIYFLEKLSVLPNYRHRGFGKELIDQALKKVSKLNGKKVSIGIINESNLLKD